MSSLMLRFVVWYKRPDDEETSVNFYQTTQSNIPEDSHLQDIFVCFPH
jgi:hypothetical protein